MFAFQPGISCGTRIIHMTPNLSVTMPKAGEKKVFDTGLTTWPPSPSALNHLFTCASSLAGSDRPKPANCGLPEHMPSEAMITLPPTLKEQCITFSSELGGGWQPGSSDFGASGGVSLKRIS